MILKIASIAKSKNNNISATIHYNTVSIYRDGVSY